MAPLNTVSPSFPILSDTQPDDTTLPAFMVSTTRGFLPRADPITYLPPEFHAVESLLQQMPVKTLNGQPGLLATYQLGRTVESTLPDLTDCVDLYKENLPMLNALYRDYSFLASGYLLEPCHERFVNGQSYGLARSVLPRQIARPIARCAELCGFKPWMEYAGSYALYNYRLADPTGGMAYSNLRLIRAFEHGLDPTSSEAGFVLVHVDMVKHSGPLVAGTMACFDVCEGVVSGRATDAAATRREFNAGLATVLDAMRKINAGMDRMWAMSKPGAYTSFRTFIFGITSQSMFPNGVLYEGVNDGKAMSFRGESGANDSIIPLMDNLLQIPMPSTPLTDILKDFRQYRPSNHRAFLVFAKDKSLELGVKDYALFRPDAMTVFSSSPSSSISSSSIASMPSSKDAEAIHEHTALLRASRQLWLQLLDQVREFRWRHWCFAREYILKQTTHPTATGGSPIVTWLPNQLGAVLEEMERVFASIQGGSKYREEGDEREKGDGAGNEDGEWGEVCRDIMALVVRQKTILAREVEKYCVERGVKRRE